MKRWRLVVIVLIVVGSAAVALRYVRKAEAKKKREAYYQSALQAYSRNLRPGSTRREVDGDLLAKGIGFLHASWLEERQSALADLVKVGEEDAPWFCSGHSVYVAFEFAATESHPLWEAWDSDVLGKVRIYSQLESCL